MAKPKKNSLWSRKDARRPGVVKVTKVESYKLDSTSFDVHVENIETGRKSIVYGRDWERRYRPFVSPTAGTPTAPADEQEK